MLGTFATFALTSLSLYGGCRAITDAGLAHVSRLQALTW
jgi:hypothetical protein